MMQPNDAAPKGTPISPIVKRIMIVIGEHIEAHEPEYTTENALELGIVLTEVAYETLEHEYYHVVQHLQQCQAIIARQQVQIANLTARQHVN